MHEVRRVLAEGRAFLERLGDEAELPLGEGAGIRIAWKDDETSLVLKAESFAITASISSWVLRYTRYG
jgi:hypothetical protein